MPNNLILHYSELYNYFIIYPNVIITKVKSTINVLASSQNHPLPLLSPHPGSKEKLSSTKLVPGAKNVGDHCPRGKEDGVTTPAPAINR